MACRWAGWGELPGGSNAGSVMCGWVIVADFERVTCVQLADEEREFMEPLLPVGRFGHAG